MSVAAFDLSAFLPPGIVATRALQDALCAAYQANGGQLTQAQILAITGPAPAFPSTLPRFADSNASPEHL